MFDSICVEVADGFQVWKVVLEHGCIINPSDPSVLKAAWEGLHPRPELKKENVIAIKVAVLWAVKSTSP